MQTVEQTMKTPEEMIKDLAVSNGPHNEEVARLLIEKGILSLEPTNNWIVYSPADIMMFIPIIKGTAGLYFTAQKYADIYLAARYAKKLSHKDIRVYQLKLS